MSTRPQPESFKTGAEYRWARRLWRRRTGGSLITTAALALIVGGLSGSAVLAMLTLFGALGVHLYLRSTRSDRRGGNRGSWCSLPWRLS
jgi:hypothetical protein